MTASGEVSWEIVLGAVWHIVADIMHSKDWPRSFSSVGIANAQGNVSARTLRRLQMEATFPEVGRGLPTLPDLVHIFPKRAFIPIHELFWQSKGSAGACQPQTIM